MGYLDEELVAVANLKKKLEEMPALHLLLRHPRLPHRNPRQPRNPNWSCPHSARRSWSNNLRMRCHPKHWRR